MTVETEPTQETTDPAEEQTEEHQDDDEHQDDGNETLTLDNARKLRRENATLRDRAKTAEALAEERGRELFAARVAATGKLADPTDLPYSAELLDDDDGLTNAIDELITKRPHYASRKPAGSVGQGVTGKDEQPFSMMGRLKQSA